MRYNTLSFTFIPKVSKLEVVKKPAHDCNGGSE